MQYHTRNTFDGYQPQCIYYLLVIVSIVIDKTTRRSSFFHLILANAIPDFVGIATGAMPAVYEEFEVGFFLKFEIMTLYRCIVA